MILHAVGGSAAAAVFWRSLKTADFFWFITNIFDIFGSKVRQLFSVLEYLKISVLCVTEILRI